MDFNIANGDKGSGDFSLFFVFEKFLTLLSLLFRFFLWNVLTLGLRDFLYFSKIIIGTWSAKVEGSSPYFEYPKS